MMGGVLPRYAIYAAMLAAAGLPIYIHAPKFYLDEYGVSLTAIGAALVALRLIDVVQDPLLGRVAASLGHRRGFAALIAAVTLAFGMIGLFVIPAPFSPLLWMSLCLVLLFSSFSFLTILFYARGVAQANELVGGHVQLAGWRETGALLGVTVACIAPFLFSMTSLPPFVGFTLAFCILVAVAVASMHSVWQGRIEVPSASFYGLLEDSEIRRLLLIATLNAAPVAVTSTLFLFFVEYRLGQPDQAGLYLLAFFLAAAFAAPLWSKLAQRFNPTSVLASGMLLSVLAFAWAATLGLGDGSGFLLVCVLSGAALGADMTLLPALYADRIEQIGHDSGRAFGLWNFCAKLTLAIAAATVLPLLEQAGFRIGAPNDETALTRLSILYAIVPCCLKLAALGMLLLGPQQRKAQC